MNYINSDSFNSDSFKVFEEKQYIKDTLLYANAIEKIKLIEAAFADPTIPTSKEYEPLLECLLETKRELESEFENVIKEQASLTGVRRHGRHFPICTGSVQFLILRFGPLPLYYHLVSLGIEVIPEGSTW